MKTRFWLFSLVKCSWQPSAAMEQRSAAGREPFQAVRDRQCRDHGVLEDPRLEGFINSNPLTV